MTGILIHIIISGVGIYGAAVVPDSGVGNTWQRLTLVLHKFLSNGLTPSRLHIVISFLTHADHVFLGLPRSMVPGSPKCVMELMHEVARCTCPYHLRRRVRRTAVISSRSSFWRITAEEISNLPALHRRSTWSWHGHFCEAVVDRRRLGPRSHCHGA